MSPLFILSCAATTLAAIVVLCMIGSELAPRGRRDGGYRPRYRGSDPPRPAPPSSYPTKNVGGEKIINQAMTPKPYSTGCRTGGCGCKTTQPVNVHHHNGGGVHIGSMAVGALAMHALSGENLSGGEAQDNRQDERSLAPSEHVKPAEDERFDDAGYYRGGEQVSEPDAVEVDLIREGHSFEQAATFESPSSDFDSSSSYDSVCGD